VGSLVRFIMRSRTYAISVAVLGMLVPPFSFVSGGIIGATALRRGVADGTLILVLCVAVPALVMTFWSVGYQPVIVFALFTGIPVILLAQVLRRTASEAITLTAAGAVAALVLAGIHLLTSDPVAWLGAKLESLIVQPIRDTRPDASPEMLELLGAIVEALSVPAATVSGFMMIALLTLWLGRWMQAVLDNPGGFGKEFRELRLDRRVAYAGVALALLAIVAGRFAAGLFPAWFVIVINMYTIQGIALVHGVVHKRRASAGWLAVMYVGLVLFSPIASLGLALAGISDTWFDFRRRWGAGT
jgi:hypothetical protein